MTWVKVSDSLPRLPEFRAIGKDAKLLYVASLCHTSDNLTDGHVQSIDLPLIAAMVGVAPKAHAGLVDAGLWRVSGDGWEVVQPGFSKQSEWRRSREQRDRVRAQRAAAGRKGGKAKAKAASVPAEESEVVSKLLRNPSSNEVTVGQASRLAELEVEALSEGERASSVDALNGARAALNGGAA